MKSFWFFVNVSQSYAEKGRCKWRIITPVSWEGIISEGIYFIFILPIHKKIRYIRIIFVVNRHNMTQSKKTSNWNVSTESLLYETWCIAEKYQSIAYNVVVTTWYLAVRWNWNVTLPDIGNWIDIILALVWISGIISVRSSALSLDAILNIAEPINSFHARATSLEKY